MSLENKIHITCPVTGDLVSTGAIVEYSEFGDKTPSGIFNCPSCKESHTWDYAQAQIYLVAR